MFVFTVSRNLFKKNLFNFESIASNKELATGKITCMGLSVLAVVVIWFMCGFIINYAFESDETDLQKKRFHMAAALQIIINIIAVIVVLSLILN